MEHESLIHSKWTVFVWFLLQFKFFEVINFTHNNNKYTFSQNVGKYDFKLREDKHNDEKQMKSLIKMFSQDVMRLTLYFI